MSTKLDPAIWSRDTGQRIPCFDRCQLLITRMSNIKGVHRKEEQCNGLLTINQGRMSSYYVEYGRHVARLRRRRRRRRRAYVPTSNTASHDNHEKINSWVFFFFPI